MAQVVRRRWRRKVERRWQQNHQPSVRGNHQPPSNQATSHCIGNPGRAGKCCISHGNKVEGTEHHKLCHTCMRRTTEIPMNQEFLHAWLWLRLYRKIWCSTLFRHFFFLLERCFYCKLAAGPARGFGHAQPAEHERDKRDKVILKNNRPLHQHFHPKTRALISGLRSSASREDWDLPLSPTPVPTRPRCHLLNET